MTRARFSLETAVLRPECPRTLALPLAHRRIHAARRLFVPPGHGVDVAHRFGDRVPQPVAGHPQVDPLLQERSSPTPIRASATYTSVFSSCRIRASSFSASRFVPRMVFVPWRRSLFGPGSRSYLIAQEPFVRCLMEPFIPISPL